MAWIQEASRHVLVSNLFVLHSTPSDYFQPAIALSGGLSALGVPPWVSLLVWKPIAVVALFYAFRGYVNRSLPDLWPRRAALVLALFFGSFSIVYGSVGTVGDLLPAFLAWGYPFALLGTAAMIGALLTYERARATGTVRWSPGVLGAAASLLHPWHGALLIAVVGGAELIVPRRRGARAAQLALPALTAGITALPLAYYVLLGHVDVTWRLARAASKHAYPLWAITLELAPLLLPALLLYRKRPRTFLKAATLVWPVAAFALFELSTTRFAATPVHAFQGITLPLSILAVQGVLSAGFRRLRHSVVWACVLVAAFTFPTTYWQLNNARRTVRPRPGDNDLITKDEGEALHYLARDPRPGGVISRVYLGELVPAATGRHTFVGDCLWSQPGCAKRQITVRKLFAGQLGRAQARWLIQSPHTRFLLADCRQTVPLDRLFPNIIIAVHRFGCAAVYEVA
jgi:hypothetical protein